MAKRKWLSESFSDYFTPLTWAGFGGGGNDYYTPPMPYYEDGETQDKLETYNEFMLENDELIGGVADNMDLSDIAEKHGIDIIPLNKQLKVGIQIEMEHTDDVGIASEIARDHLAENPEYYKELIKAGLVDKPVDMSERLESFDEFTGSGKSVYDKGCMMLMLDDDGWDDIVEMIGAQDVYVDDSDKFGLEKEPHVTILYGLLSDQIDTKKIVDYMRNSDFEDWPVISKQISIFENELFDVVKFDVLQDATVDTKINWNNNYLKSNYPWTSNYDGYEPHITIAYVKKGTGQKYAKMLEQPLEFKGTRLQYSTPTEKWDVFNSILGKVPFKIPVNENTPTGNDKIQAIWDNNTEHIIKKLNLSKHYINTPFLDLPSDIQNLIKDYVNGLSKSFVA